MAKNRTRAARPLVVRITHWVNAFAMICMISERLAHLRCVAAVRLHLPALGHARRMARGRDRVAFRGHVAPGRQRAHLSRVWLPLRLLPETLLPIAPRQIWQDLLDALRFRLEHRSDAYNAVQKLLYIIVLLLGAAAVLSGLAIWKPVQFSPVTALLGGYDTARFVHFLAMAGIVGFIGIHLILVVLVPRTLLSMISGATLARGHAHETEART